MLLHGLGDDGTTWDAVSAQLADRFRVVALDLRGHGRSNRPGAYSFELMRDDVVGALAALELADVTLLGHSMGGVVAYLVAQAQSERVVRLIVEDVSPPFPRSRPVPARPDGELPFDWAVVPAISAEVDDPSMRWWPPLRGIRVPTLLIGGGDGSHIPQGKLADVAALIPDCTLVTIPVGHDVHESDPTRFIETVLHWIEAQR